MVHCINLLFSYCWLLIHRDASTLSISFSQSFLSLLLLDWKNVYPSTCFSAINSVPFEVVLVLSGCVRDLTGLLFFLQCKWHIADTVSYYMCIGGTRLSTHVLRVSREHLHCVAVAWHNVLLLLAGTGRDCDKTSHLSVFTACSPWQRAYHCWGTIHAWHTFMFRVLLETPENQQKPRKCQLKQLPTYDNVCWWLFLVAFSRFLLVCWCMFLKKFFRV